MIDLMISICFEMILESDNIKPDGVKAETKIECGPNGAVYCDGRTVCNCPHWSVGCQCNDCRDQPWWCFKNKELHQEFVNRKSKESPETIPMTPEN